MSTEVHELVELLFGGGGDDLIHKMNPAPSDISTSGEKDRKKRAATAALSGVGAAAGAGGLVLSGKELRHGYKEQLGPKPPTGVRAPGSRLRAVGSTIKNKKVAAALLPLEVAGLGGELMATKILHGDAKKKKQGALVKKDLGELLNNSGDIPTTGSVTRAVLTSPKVKRKRAEYKRKTKGTLKAVSEKVVTHNEVEKAAQTRSRGESIAYNSAAGASLAALPIVLSRRGGTKQHFATLGAGALVGGAYGAGKPLTHPKPKKPKKKADPVEKSAEVDVVWEGEFSKVNSDKQQVFGWASIVEMNGEPVVDLQGDYIAIDEVEKAAYSYVHKSRKGGDMHLRDETQNVPIEKSHMIESFVVTPEKKQALGLSEATPTGWWVGYQVNDPEVWAKVKSGERTGFSIHGHGKRTPMEF